MENYVENLDDKSLSESDKIGEIVKKIDGWYSYFSENNDKGKNLKSFLMGAQWNSSETRYYKNHNKVPLVINKLYAFVMQLIGEERQISPNLKVTPVNYNPDDPAVSKTTNLIEDIIQSIAYNSKSNIVYQTAYKNQLELGYGAILVYTDYRNENSFDQEIKLMAVEEPQCCYFDPSSREMDKSDGEFCGMISFMSKEEFKKKYPDIDLSDIKNMAFYDKKDSFFHWIDENNVAIADHYQKNWNKKTICRLSDGSTVDKSDLETTLRKKAESLKIMQQLEMLSQVEGRPINLTRGIEKIEVVDEREVSYCSIKHYRLVRNHILEENDVAGKNLRLVFVDGDSYFLDGQQYIRPFIEFAKDTQKFINYCATETMSYIRGGRKEKFLTTKTHLQGNEEAWRGIDNDNLSLPYNPDPMAPPPSPISPLDIPQTLLQQYQRAENDLYTVLGRYEPAVGAKSREVSRVALDARIRQGNTTAFVYPDNLRRAQNQIGKIILDLLPTVYDTYRTIVVERQGQRKETIEINKTVDKNTIENKIERQDYEIEVVSGSSFATQKAEAYGQLMDLIARIPAFSGIIPDLAAENLELSNAPKIVERARKYLIPQIAMEEQGQQPPPPKPDPQQQLMASMAQSEQKKADASLISAQAKMMKAESDVRQDFDDNEVRKIEAAAEVGKAQMEYDTAALKHATERSKMISDAMENIGIV